MLGREVKNAYLYKKERYMKNEFVPYELALRMKALGFNGPCFGYYDGNRNLNYMFEGKPENFSYRKFTLGHFVGWTSAPTFSQAFRWFRDVHELLHELISCVENSWLITVVDMNSKSVNGVYMKRVNLDDRDENIPKTYEEAELACLEKLLEIVESLKEIR